MACPISASWRRDGCGLLPKVCIFYNIYSSLYVRY